MKDDRYKQFQQRFFDKVKQMIPSGYSLVDELSDLLEISNDSVYRRLRGETSLTLDELSILCTHYKIEFEMFKEGGVSTVTFNYSPLTLPSDFNKYMKSLVTDMQRFKAAKEKLITYCAVDIPIFHHFNYPALSAFKIFYWIKAVLNDENFQTRKFSVNYISDEYAAYGKQVYDIYLELPSVEIWTAKTIDGTLKQIEFYWDSGQFETKDDALRVCDEYMNELRTIAAQAELSSKSKDQKNNFTLYQCEIEVGNNCILVETDGLKSTYLSFNTFNKMATQNINFCKETENWLETLKAKSLLISGVSQKQRYKFFKVALSSVEQLRRKIIDEVLF